MDKKRLKTYFWYGICVQMFGKLFFCALQTKPVKNEDGFRNAGVDIM
jgi:hypothetical protein